MAELPPLNLSRPPEGTPVAVAVRWFDAKMARDGLMYMPNRSTLERWAAHVERVESERDRLRAILLCEQGKAAPEGWTRTGKFSHDWEHHAEGLRVDEMSPGRWQAFRWTGQEERMVGDEHPSALECIEAAVKAEVRS